MARRKTDSLPTGRFVCTCGEDMGAERASPFGKFPGWRHGPVLHCEGSSLGLGCRRIGIVHHGHEIYNCPSCGFHLGCTHCVARNVACRKCHIYVDGSYVMTQDNAKRVWKLVYAVIDKKMTQDQALDALEKLGNTEMMQEEVPF